MDNRKDSQRELDFAQAEAMFRESLSSLGNLAKVMGASCYEANVLRFIFEEGGYHRDVELWIERIAGIPWIQAGENTVRRALKFWEDAGIIEIERDRRGANRQAPNTARLLRSSILRRLLGEGRSTASSPSPSAGQSEAPGGHSDPRFSDTQGGASDTQGGASDTQGGASDTQGGASDTQGGYLKPPFSRSPIRVLACARGLLSLSSVCTVVDDVSLDRRVEYSAIWDLAEEARLPLYPGNWPRDPQVKQAFVQGAVLACMLFSRKWILAGTRAAQAKSGVVLWRYWIGCLRNGLTEVEGVEPFPTQQETASYFATLMNAVAPVAEAVIAEYGQAELVPAAMPSEPPSTSDPSPQARAWREKLERRREAQNRRNREDPQ